MPPFPGSNPGRPATIWLLRRCLESTQFDAEVAKLVDAPDLGSGAARCESSSLSFRTIIEQTQLRLGFVLSGVLIFIALFIVCENKKKRTR